MTSQSPSYYKRLTTGIDIITHLACPVCMEVYRQDPSGDKQPLVGFCGHTLCQQCWLHIQGRPKLCPICRRIQGSLPSPNYALTGAMEDVLALRVHRRVRRRVLTDDEKFGKALEKVEKEINDEEAKTKRSKKG